MRSKISKNFDLKIFHFHIIFNGNFRKFSKIFDLKNFRGMHLWMDADHRLINRFPSDQKHRPRHCQKSADVKYLALIVVSRGEKKEIDYADTESRKLAPT